MKRSMLRQAVEIAQRMGHVFLATSDPHGLPHVATAARLGVNAAGRLEISEWFCPGTVANLHVNPHVSVVAWDSQADEGVQLLGTVEEVVDYAIMDGFDPSLSKQPPLPQVHKKLIIAVDKSLHFTLAPHSDVEEDIREPVTGDRIP